MSRTPHPAVLAQAPEPADHACGSDHARVTVVEYGDFECPTCRTASATPQLLVERFPGVVRFIYRHFPLEFAHPHALAAAEASEAAAAQGRFWPMHDLIFQHQSHLAPKDLERYAATVGLDMLRYRAEMDDHI